MATCPHCDQSHAAGSDYCPRTGRPIADVSDRMIGRSVAGKYKLTKCIGQGGMGTIFEAEHSLIGNRVAVKMLHEPFAAKREPVQRLYREAQATGAIGHPNIIKVHDVGETEEGVPFLVMELLEGESLGEHIERNGPRPIGFVIDFTVQMLSALHAAHRSGIIHRDLKSDNIFLLQTDDDELRIKILDFGISKIATPDDAGLKLTQTGTLLGTPYYMSPEQASGRTDVDARIDIYAAGVIIYEALMGVVPHRADNYNALLIEIITEDIAPFRFLRPDVSERLEAAVLTALARSREDRWQTAVDFMEELVAIRRELPATLLRGAPMIGQRVDGVSGDSATIDVADLPRITRADVSQLAFETGGGITLQPPARTSMLRAAAWIVGSLGVIAVVSLAFLWLFTGTSEEEQNQPLDTSTAGVTAAADIGELAEQSIDNEPPASVHLSVRVEPAHALVTVDGKPVPSDGLAVPRNEEPLKLVAEAEGFVTRTMDVVPVEDVDLDITLEASPSLKDEVADSPSEKTSVTEATIDQGKPTQKVGKVKTTAGKAGLGKKHEVVAAEKGQTKPEPKTPGNPKDASKKKQAGAKSLDRPMDNPFRPMDNPF